MIFDAKLVVIPWFTTWKPGCIHHPSHQAHQTHQALGALMACHTLHLDGLFQPQIGKNRHRRTSAEHQKTDGSTKKDPNKNGERRATMSEHLSISINLVFGRMYEWLWMSAVFVHMGFMGRQQLKCRTCAIWKYRSMAYHCNQLLPGTAGVLHGEARYEWRKPAPKIDTLEIIVFKYVIYIYIICINIICMYIYIYWWLDTYW